MGTLDSRELWRRIQAGDRDAATDVVDRYVARLIALTRGRIGARLGRRVDAEDVVQSAYRSFFVHAGNDEYAVSASGDLWRLLAGIALKKLHRQIERHTAQRRAMNREEAVADVGAQFAGTVEPTPAEMVAIAEQLQAFHRGLSTVEQAMLEARLRGRSVDEVAELVGKSARTVRRVLAELEERLRRELASETPSGGRERDYSKEPDPRAPLAFGDFRLERLVGAGAMGKVYRATRLSTGEVVAVKSLLKARLDDVAAVEKFLQEAQILACLRHPNIVGVHGAGRFPGGGYFIAMDFIDGEDLQSRLARGPLPVGEAVRVVETVAYAVGHAHAREIVHGDLKPGNVIVDARGRAFVTDFGLAQFVGARGRGAAPWLVGGTLGYVAPEVSDLGTAPTPAADVYGLGALLWALVTGTPPGEGWAAEAGTMSLRKAFWEKCLALSAAGRFGSVEELADSLASFAPT